MGRYIGETEEKVNEVLKQARGNVLFIDEAYSLCDSADDRKDYGNRVVESLLTVLAQPHPDMLVILAGYADEMERLLQMNPGLESRFPHRFHFDDYTAEELLQIARDLLQRQQYLCEPDADRALDEVVRRAVAGKDRYFGNARWGGPAGGYGHLAGHGLACHAGREAFGPGSPLHPSGVKTWSGLPGNAMPVRRFSWLPAAGLVFTA